MCVLPLRIRTALANADFPDCRCRQTLFPHCLIDEPPRCRERRHAGTCSCRQRALPDCLADGEGGCRKRRNGKRCRCAPALLPECLQSGCSEQKQGHTCDCPRCYRPCKHVSDKVVLAKMLACILALNNFAVPGTSPDEGWHFFLVLANRKEYVGPTQLPVPADLCNREVRIATLAWRNENGLALYHPDDNLYADANESPRNLQRRLRGLSAILSPSKERS